MVVTKTAYSLILETKEGNTGNGWRPFPIEYALQKLAPILNQYDCPIMNARIGIDIGENAVIQWLGHSS